MNANATITASDFWSASRGFLRLVYEEIIVISIVSMGASLLAIPVITIGPAILAAIATVTTAAEQRRSPTGPTDRERVRLFLDSFRRYFRVGLVFSALIAASALVTGAYAVLATTDGSSVFWFGTALGLYTTLAVVALTFRAGSVIVRAGNDPPGPPAAIKQGIDVWLASPGYATLHLLIAGLLQVGLILVPPAAIVLLAGSLAMLEVIAYEDLVGDGVGSLFE
jgi:hypothetical protein